MRELPRLARTVDAGASGCLSRILPSHVSVSSPCSCMSIQPAFRPELVAVANSRFVAVSVSTPGSTHRQLSLPMPRSQLFTDAGFRSVTKPTSETSAKELWERFFCLSASTGSASACPPRSLKGRWHSDRTTGRAAGIVHPPRLSHRAAGPMPTARRRNPCCAISGHRPPMPGSHSARRGSLTPHPELDSALSRFHG